MDPNVALANLRAAVTDVLGFGDLSEAASEGSVQASAFAAVEAFAALDEWLSKGGFPPAAWPIAGTCRCDAIESCPVHDATPAAAVDADGHPEHHCCADACGLAVTHDGACLDKPGGRQVCSGSEHLCPTCGCEGLDDHSEGDVRDERCPDCGAQVVPA